MLMQRATTRVSRWVSESWGGCQYGPSMSACILGVFSPVLAPQVLRVEIKHWQPRRRQLVKVLHGAGAGERARRVSKRKQVVGGVLGEGRCA